MAAEMAGIAEKTEMVGLWMTRRMEMQHDS